MKLNEYQTQASAFAINTDLNHMVFGLVEEAGEAAGLLKRYHRGDEKYQDMKVIEGDKITGVFLNPTLRTSLEKELGDVLWYVAMTARRLGLTLEDVAYTNILKLTDRQQRNVIKGEGDNR
jgi:NTP pyrophosphatase (non-canonical NTP hydrolase)